MKSIPRESRLRLAGMIARLDEFEPAHPRGWDHIAGLWEKPRPFTRAEANSVASTLDRMADFWEANPKRWIRGTYFKANRGTNFKMCNVGLLSTARGGHDNYFSKPSKLIDFTAPKRAISLMEAHADWIVTLNDSAKNLEENIAGLRIAAEAYRDFAINKDWAGAVERQQNINTRLLKVQIQRLSKKNPTLAKRRTRQLAKVSGVK